MANPPKTGSFATMIKQIQDHLAGAFQGAPPELKVDLSGAALAGLDLKNSRISGVNFTGSDLTEATFASADLSGAILRDAILTGVSFLGTNLTNAVPDCRTLRLQGAIDLPPE
ncbi:hypothetical protein CH251_09595 [Rhodococcus sp. 06-462-5]|nr:hypothetical protein CH251_09595 [Rhodococcus sp. 06-462-5]OZE57886.1 hypothetical protein CH270_26825 [Rhodococcus sp. 02-925g]